MTTRCRVCHRELKRPDALLAGIGETCARKTGCFVSVTVRRLKAMGKPLFDLKAADLGVPLFPEDEVSA